MILNILKNTKGASLSLLFSVAIIIYISYNIVWPSEGLKISSAKRILLLLSSYAFVAIVAIAVFLKVVKVQKV